jgi:hypothetical protein
MDQTATARVEGRVEAKPSSIFPDAKFNRVCAWPAVLALAAMMPTANIQMSSPFWSSNETCAYARRRPDYEIYSSWYVPTWEDAKVPQLPIVGHIHATFKYKGQLKWVPYTHF